MPLLVLTGLVALLLSAWLLRPHWQRRRRRAWFATPLPAVALATLEHQVPLYRRLPDALRAQLHGHLQIFLREKKFVGCNELVIDDRMRITIAAQASLLLLNRITDYFPGFTSVLVYPESFVVPTVRRDGALETRAQEVRSGESWHHGPVVLSWADIQHGVASADTGHNVVLHEFAHKLDEENGLVDGVPALADPAAQTEWIDVLGREYDLLRLRAQHAEEVVLDAYGATSPAEFFAVATEVFFERPRALAARHPRLYATLLSYFKVDPARWSLAD